MVNKGFVINENNKYALGAISIIVDKEGQRLQFTSQGDMTLPRPTIASAPTTLSQNSATARPGRAYLLKSITISCDGPCVFLMQISCGLYTISSSGGSSNAGGSNGKYVRFGAGGGVHTLNMDNQIIYEGGSIILTPTTTGAVGTTVPAVSMDINVVDFTADFNFNAKYTMLIVGDSITVGSMETDPNGVLYQGANLWPFRVREQLLLDGIDVRMVNKGISGMDTLNGFNAVNTFGYIDGIDYDIMYISLQTNDTLATSAISTTQHVANIDAIIKHRDKHRPKASIVLLNATITDNTTRNATLGNYRTALRNYYNALNGGNPHAYNVWFYDQSFAFPLGATATTDTNFALSNRVSGSRVHPSGLGHSLLYQNALADTDNAILAGASGGAGIYPVTKLTKFYTDAIKTKNIVG